MDSEEQKKLFEAKKFGNYLRSLRKGKDMTLKQLSEATELTIGYLSNIENGRRGIPSPEILKKLADPLGVSYGELMFYAGYLNNESGISELSAEEKEGIEFQVLYLTSGEVLRGEEATNYLRSQGVVFKSEEEAEEAGKRADELELLNILNKSITLFGHSLTKDDRKRIEEMLELMFPQYAPKG
ncbi:helix-turn-helix domain-containing protein [Paenibacillus sp. GM2]|uniref:helix-turn-helix domain-containing protein n=1 Tax=Paenibacillus sp. GM2 TaxID=1622070 RepID=UPI0008392F0B|nr:helix-turn-helix transcriptional regulator [Paenibacillus sp. GM2]